MSPIDHDELKARLKALGLYGLIACWAKVADRPWLPELLAIEESERKRRSLERRLREAKLGSFKPMTDFDWRWPERIDRDSIEELFSLAFLEEGRNTIVLGPNGVGKTMIIQNLAHHAIMKGLSVRFTTASDMLADLAARDSSRALTQRLRRYNTPQLLCVDEVGYLSYNSRYADLLFEVVTSRYEARKPILLTTNKVFEEWPSVFPHAACVVTLVDRLHRAEVIELAGQSYRLKEAKEQAAARKARRMKKNR